MRKPDRDAPSDPAEMEAARLQHWERSWVLPDFAPPWRIAAIPREIQQAVRDKWFPSGAAVLDIGCGGGEIAAWLARHGYRVTGIDFANAAIARARADYASPGVDFAVANICREVPPGSPFAALLDRGCLHVIAAPLRTEYARNVAAAARRDARFLLLHRIPRKSSREDEVADIERLFDGEFSLQRIDDADLAGRAGSGGEPIPGVAVWMIRR